VAVWLVESFFGYWSRSRCLQIREEEGCVMEDMHSFWGLDRDVPDEEESLADQLAAEAQLEDEADALENRD